MPLLDYDDELTTSGGQAITVAAAGTKVKDGGAARDVGAGEILVPYARVSQAFNNLTSLDIAVQGCDDLAGTNPVVLVTKNVLLAGLTLNALIPLPPIPAGTKKRCIRAYFTPNGTAPTTGKIIVGFMGADARPQDGVNAL